MRLRTSKYLISTVLILLSFQFIAPAFVSEEIEQGSSHFSERLHKHPHQSQTLSSLFEKTEKEGEEEERDKSFAVALLDISISYSKRINASQAILLLDNVSQLIQKPPLFERNCVYLI